MKRAVSVSVSAWGFSICCTRHFQFLVKYLFNSSILSYVEEIHVIISLLLVIHYLSLKEREREKSWFKYSGIWLRAVFELEFIFIVSISPPNHRCWSWVSISIQQQLSYRIVPTRFDSIKIIRFIRSHLVSNCKRKQSKMHLRFVGVIELVRYMHMARHAPFVFPPHRKKHTCTDTHVHFIEFILNSADLGYWYGYG